MQARLLHIVVAGHAADGDHAADVLDRRSQGYGDHEQNGADVELRRDEVGHRQPGRRGDAAGVDHAEGKGQAVAHSDASENRHQTEQTLAQYRYQQRGDQRRHGDEHRRVVRDELSTAVAGLAHGHVHSHR